MRHTPPMSGGYVGQHLTASLIGSDAQLSRDSSVPRAHAARPNGSTLVSSQAGNSFVVG